MNSVAAKAMLKMVKSFISPDQIKTAAAEMIKVGIEAKRKIELNKENGEVEAVGMMYEVDETAYVAIAILDNDNRIVRFESVNTVESTIEKLIEKL